jgi:predicted ATPase/class 3 adenylate cyclase
MLTLPGVSVTSQIYESANSLVYRAIREEDGQGIILKVLKENYPTPQELTCYQTEYKITKSLNLTGVVKVYDLQRYQNTLVMFLEDFGGESLKRWMQQRRFNLEEFLQIAIAATDALGHVHAEHIIHKDLNPSNIVFNPKTGQLKIIDFGISTQLTRETPTLKNPDVLEGTLPYISPEQTGRMNRVLDYRTDFYSLGVTFYELLTNQLPFEATDALELVHCHIAKQPVAPALINSEIPPIISSLVMKMMAKTAEERYQSAWGMKADLEECLERWQTRQNITEFPLGRYDIADKFQIPQKLYGRVVEIETLLTAFNRASSEASELMLISGYSGVGKTALVREIYQPITEKRGYFISGKFDQYQRNIPYSAVVDAFQELVKQLLTETEEKLNQWREKLLAAFGANGRVIVEVIPEVELIVGKQREIPELGPKEAENRFNLVFKNFIAVFTKPEHPLALFIDDLQWADGASLKLITLLVTSSEPGLFLIGAYRDNEVSATHLLSLSLNELAKTEAIINRIYLLPLSLAAVIQLISDTLHGTENEVKPLAELVLLKTGGNPFFLGQFLKSLAEEKLLTIDYTCPLEPYADGRSWGGWRWDLEQIEARGFTDNVVELMAGKLEKLPEVTREILKLAACIGNQFELETLAEVASKSLEEIIGILDVAVAESLVLSLGNLEAITDSPFPINLPLFQGGPGGIFRSNSPFPKYKFVHDKIQQAAYSLIYDAEKPAFHYQIGRLMVENTPGEKMEEKIFDLVNQLNFGIELITKQKDKDELAGLNLMAGKKAKSSAAYNSALNYLELGIALLGETGWQREYDLALSLHTNAAEAAYVNRNFARMEQLAEIVLKRGRNVLDKVRVTEVKILAFSAQNKLGEAVNAGVEILRELGVRLPAQPNRFHVWMELWRTKLALAGKQTSDLANLPPMSDATKLAASSILVQITAPAYLTGSQLLPLISCQQVRLSLKYGFSGESAYGYACYGLILCGVVGDIDGGYKFGQVALGLLGRSPAKKFAAKTLHMVNTFITHWKAPIIETLPVFLETYKKAAETGDLEYGSYAAFGYCFHSYLIGKQLTDLDAEMTEYLTAIRHWKQQQILYEAKPCHQAVLNLLGEGKNPCFLTGKACHEETILPLLIENKEGTALFIFYFNKLFICYLFEEHSGGLLSGNQAEKYVISIAGSVFIAKFNFYDSLVRLALISTASKSDAKAYFKKVVSNQKQMHKWAKYAPMNYLHKYYLVEAERHRVLKKDNLARHYYDRSIALAKKNEYIHETALAYELAAKFYLSRDNELTAKAYMQEARYCYQLWGAVAKVKDLEKRYPQLFITTRLAKANKLDSLNITTTGSRSQLDIATVMKASQAFAKEIMLDKLLAKAMKILVENAGAEKGYLILEKEGKLIVEAEGSLATELVTVCDSLGVESCDFVSTAIINYVTRTQETVVLNDAVREGKFTKDSYIKKNRPKSVLCVPLINQGKLVSIVYLENNLTTNAFTRDRLEIVNLLSSSAAISIENAKLYSDLSQANQNLQIALNNELKLAEAASRFVPNQFLAFLGYDSLIETKLGDAVRLEMSVLFSDIRDFTTMSETMTPEDNFRFINSYLSRMEPAILEHEGFIDKYIGDAIMALFGGEADNAVKAGIYMLNLLSQYNQQRANSGYYPIRIGIGINTGSLILGTVGGENRMDGTVISDAVNLASRVESLTKNYGVSLLITQQTFSRLKTPTDYAIRTIGKAKVKGKSEQVTVYEVFDADPSSQKQGKLNTLSIFAEALSLYHSGELAAAGRLFGECLGAVAGDTVARFYFDRCFTPSL